MDKIKPIALAFSDFHTAKWKQFNDNQQRTLQPFNIINKMVKMAQQLNIKTFLFSGDLNDHPKHVDNEVMGIWARLKLHLQPLDIKVYGIDGNHDFSEVNTIDKNIKGFFTHLSVLTEQFFCVNFKYYDTNEFRVLGIPYLNGNAHYKKALIWAKENRSKKKPNILLIHRDLPTALEPNGKSIGEMEDTKILKKYFKKFTLVLSGHIHKPQRLKVLGPNVYMLGATNQQRRSDAGTKMGYWIIYSDFSMQFVDLEQPEFKYHEHGITPPNDDNYWIQLPPEAKTAEEVSDQKFNVYQKRDKLIKNYLKVKGIKNKKKLHLLMDLIND